MHVFAVFFFAYHEDLHFTDPAAYIRDSYSTHSSEGMIT